MEEITYYQHFTDTCPVKTTMENIVRLIRDDETVAAKTAAHRADPEAGHKRTCPLFAVAGIMEGGKAESNIVAMTGLAMVDVDHVSSQEGGGSQPLETLFGRLCGDPHTLLCYRTISGDGIRVVFRYELDDGYDLEQQKQYHPRAFLYGNEYYRRTYGVAYDEKCKNVGRLSGLSHDRTCITSPGHSRSPRRRYGRLPSASSAGGRSSANGSVSCGASPTVTRRRSVRRWRLTVPSMRRASITTM